MRRLTIALFYFVAVLCAMAAGSHTRVRLVLDAATARPGDTVLAGIHLQMDPNWHTYWRNPGASGMATTIKWELPAGITAGEIKWPLPDKLPEQDLTTYIYHDETVLLVPLTISADAKGPLQISAKISWLECEVQCVPGSDQVSTTLQITQTNQPSADAAFLRSWMQRVPRQDLTLMPVAWWDGPAQGSTRKIILQWNTSAQVANPDLFPDAAKTFEVGGETEVLKAPPGALRLRKVVQKLSGWPTELSGVVVGGEGTQRTGYEIRVPIGDSESAAATKTHSSSAPGSPRSQLWKILLSAFIGGLILNIMPCVLPVIALKILGFVSQANDNPARVRKMGLIYGVGVWTSFALLAGLVIGVKAAGHQAGWGMQFANPQFLVVLTILVTLVALNLFGLFEITPGGAVMDKAGGLASRGGASGAFFNGVLATVLATPCTAPFLGAALGFAFAADAGTILLVFSTVALGLAAPYIILSWNPGWLKFIPKPGVWMDHFKVAMGFPMLATAAWLFSLTQGHYGGKTLWLLLFLVGLAMAAWLYGQFVQRTSSRRLPALLAVGILLASGYLVALEGQMQWRSAQPDAVSSAISTKGGIPWEPWSADAVNRAQSQGRPVLVDFTADWCLTCQANKKFAIEIPSVRSRLKEIDAVTLLGDYTRLPPDITKELQRFGRAGVPLVLVYPKNSEQPPIVLPEALTPGLVLDALDRASR
jgi:thiol:disulfide interchange protein DsbD